jgi:hypothetical protein
MFDKRLDDAQSAMINFCEIYHMVKNTVSNFIGYFYESSPQVDPSDSPRSSTDSWVTIDSTDSALHPEPVYNNQIKSAPNPNVILRDGILYLIVSQSGDSIVIKDPNGLCSTINTLHPDLKVTFYKNMLTKIKYTVFQILDEKYVVYLYEQGGRAGGMVKQMTSDILQRTQTCCCDNNKCSACPGCFQYHCRCTCASLPDLVWYRVTTELEKMHGGPTFFNKIPATRILELHTQGGQVYDELVIARKIVKVKGLWYAYEFYVETLNQALRIAQEQPPMLEQPIQQEQAAQVVQEALDLIVQQSAQVVQEALDSIVEQPIQEQPPMLEQPVQQPVQGFRIAHEFYKASYNTIYNNSPKIS